MNGVILAGRRVINIHPELIVTLGFSPLSLSLSLSLSLPLSSVSADEQGARSHASRER